MSVTDVTVTEGGIAEEFGLYETVTQPEEPAEFVARTRNS